MKLTKEEKKEKRAEKQRSMPYKKPLLVLIVLSALTLAVSAGLCTFAALEHFSVYSYISSLAEENGTELARASKQGNLGNFNVASTGNTIKAAEDGTYLLTCELQFTNFGKVGFSFNDAVKYTAYQNDKEVKSLVNPETIDEADVKVRNGRSTKVILTFSVPKSDTNVVIDMKAGNYRFTYTLKLSASAQQQTDAAAEATVAAEEQTVAAEGNG